MNLTGKGIEFSCLGGLSGGIKKIETIYQSAFSGKSVIKTIPENFDIDKTIIIISGVYTNTSSNYNIKNLKVGVSAISKINNTVTFSRLSSDINVNFNYTFVELKGVKKIEFEFRQVQNANNSTVRINKNEDKKTDLICYNLPARNDVNAINMLDKVTKNENSLFDDYNCMARVDGSSVMYLSLQKIEWN